MDKRYMIYVSHDINDMPSTKNKLFERLLLKQYLVSGSSLVLASNNNEFKATRLLIDNCDCFILVLGSLFGSINPSSQITFVEQEYRYAQSKDIPLYIFLKYEENNLPETDLNSSIFSLLKYFLKRICRNYKYYIWDDTSDLINKILAILKENICLETENTISEHILENDDISQLMADNNHLLNENRRLSTIIKSYEFIEKIACGHELYRVKGTEERKLKYSDKITIDNLFLNFSWDEIFISIAPSLFVGKSIEDFTYELIDGLNVRSGNRGKYNSISKESVQDIKVQFVALKLIEVIEYKMSSKRLIELIQLTEEGKYYLIKKGYQRR